MCGAAFQRCVKAPAYLPTCHSDRSPSDGEGAAEESAVLSRTMDRVERTLLSAAFNLDFVRSVECPNVERPWKSGASAPLNPWVEERGFQPRLAHHKIRTGHDRGVPPFKNRRVGHTKIRWRPAQDRLRNALALGIHQPSLQCFHKGPHVIRTRFHIRRRRGIFSHLLEYVY